MKKAPIVKTLSKFLETVEQIQKEWSDKDGNYIYPWFRGHASNTHLLLPGLYRDQKDIDNENSYRSDFQLKAFPFLTDTTFGVPANDWEWYFVMQHYGLPTRLLDWSEGCLIALHFALFFKHDDDQTDACVWMLNPFELSRFSNGDPVIYDSADGPIAPYLPQIWSSGKPPNRPVAIQPAYKSKRIVVQKGMFTIHGEDQTPLEDIKELDPWLKRIDIRYEETDLIKAELQMAGITQSTLFPELSGLAMELREYWRQ